MAGLPHLPPSPVPLPPYICRLPPSPFFCDTSPMANRLVIFFSAGEPSGDLHGANLIRQLRRRSGTEAVGYGGPKMAAAGCQLARRPDGPGRDVVRPGAGQPAQILGPGKPGRSLFSPSPARCRGAGRLSGLQLVDRPAGEGPRHSGVLLHAAADLGLGAVAGEEDAAAGGPRAVQPAFRGGVAPTSAAATPRSWAIRISTKSAGSRSTRRFSAEQRPRPGPLVAILPGSRTQEVTHNLQLVPEGGRQVRAGGAARSRFAIAAFKPQQAEIARRARSAASGCRSRSTWARRPS